MDKGLQKTSSSQNDKKERKNMENVHDETSVHLLDMLRATVALRTVILPKVSQNRKIDILFWYIIVYCIFLFYGRCFLPMVIIIFSSSLCVHSCLYIFFFSFFHFLDLARYFETFPPSYIGQKECRRQCGADQRIC